MGNTPNVANLTVVVEVIAKEKDNQMKYLKPVFFILIVILSGCQNSEVKFEDAFCIENITTIDADNGLKPNQTLIIKEGKIHQITPSQELQLSKENTIIDGTGKFLIPGLWDAHVHFAYMEELAPRMFDLFLAYGITSVRDTGGEIGFVNTWKQKSLANPTSTPRVMIAGPLLDGTPNVYDGSDPGHPALSVGLNTLEDVKEQINKLEIQGVDFLKAYEMLSPEQFALIAKLGKEKGLKVTGHVPLSMDVISASNAGLNSMEHLRNLELSCASNAEELLQQRQESLRSGKDMKGAALRSKIHQDQREIAIDNYDENKAQEVLNVLAANDTWQIPTLTLNTASTKLPFAEMDFKESFKFLPKTVEDDWNQGIDKLSNRDISAANIKRTEWTLNITEKMHKSGINIMAGTDCPIFYLTPGRSLHQELVLLVEAGLTPLEALRTATLNPAKYFNLEDELGTIEEGKWADLVILNANPLEDIKNTTRIDGVIKQGNYFDSHKLDQKLKRLDEE
ncbi:amidohydrolase family protein [Cyclobacterium qasimii]|nr:amidohydrolase family protein [Cyclobacterium qasimii]